ncbi:MAG: SprT-like domain-containing protein [Candidatus Caenarcaniphilales bacterium]|nr:SprT-like domain-containing protein [Candidatus Caenarcaniphilales bacterium]
MTATTATAEQAILSEAVLYALFDQLNQTHFDSTVPLCRIKWSDRIGTGKNYHRFADFTVFADRQFMPVIRLSKNLLAKETIKRICEVLFHEMTHIWLWDNKRPWGHTPEFHEKAKTFNFSLIDVPSDQPVNN